MNRTKLKTLAVTGFLAASMGISSLAATPPAAFARPMDCSQASRLARDWYRDANRDFARGDVIGGLQSLAKASEILTEHCSGPWI